MDKIKVGQIGTAHGHAAGKLSALRASTDYEVVGFVEPDAQRAAKAQAATEYQDVPLLTQEQLLNTPGLKAVAVETSIRDLLSAAQACIDAGMHIHLDKPAGSSVAGLKKLLDAASAKHLAVQLGYMYRYNPAVVMLKEFLSDGSLGEPFEVHAVMSKVVSPAQRKAHGEYPGGMMFELGCHLVDLVVDLLGSPGQVTAFAQRAGDADDALIDNMLAVFEYPSAIASVKTSAMEVEGFDRRHLVVCGTAGTFHIQPLDAPNVRLALSQPRGPYKSGVQEIKFGDYPRYTADLADLALIIQGAKDADYSYAHDYAVQETLYRACGLSLEWADEPSAAAQAKAG